MAPPASKIGGGKNNFRGQKSEKMFEKHANICFFANFYDKIVNFGLILTHLSLFFGEGQENIFLEMPHAPCGTATVQGCDLSGFFLIFFLFSSLYKV